MVDIVLPAVRSLHLGSPSPIPVSIPGPSVNLATLVELKLAARRWRDFADVVELIRFNNLDESFANRLHLSVRADYIECLEEMRREDEYEARQDRAVEQGPGEDSSVQRCPGGTGFSPRVAKKPVPPGHR